MASSLAPNVTTTLNPTLRNAAVAGKILFLKEDGFEMKLKTVILAAITTTGVITIFLTTSDINQAIVSLGGLFGGIIGLNAGLNLASKKKKEEHI